MQSFFLIQTMCQRRLLKGIRDRRQMNSYHFTVNQPIIFVSLRTETSIVPAILRKEKVDEDGCSAQEQYLLLVPRTKELTQVTSHKKHVFPCFLETTKRHPSNSPQLQNVKGSKALLLYFQRLMENLETKKIILSLGYSSLSYSLFSKYPLSFPCSVQFVFLISVPTYQQEY